MALPLLSIDSNIQIKVDFKLRNFNSLINCDGSTSSITEVAPNINVFADYIFLDDDEKRMFQESDQEYLIEQVQQLGGVGKYNSFKASIDISEFNHPVKELIWVCRNNTSLTENTSTSNLQNIDASSNNEGSTFTNNNDILNLLTRIQGRFTGEISLNFFCSLFSGILYCT